MSSVSGLGGFIYRVWQKWNIICIDMFSFMYNHVTHRKSKAGFRH